MPYTVWPTALKRSKILHCYILYLKLQKILGIWGNAVFLRKRDFLGEIFKHTEIADVKLRIFAKLSSLQFLIDLFNYACEMKDIIEADFAMYQVD